MEGFSTLDSSVTSLFLMIVLNSLERIFEGIRSP
jgi:hypothetical protein